MFPENKNQKQQKIASYFIIGTVMWEFFSFFGMQALLILYLVQKLHFSDSDAYAIYGAFTSLIFVTPIIGGWLADKFCGYRYAVMWGCVLIIIGHISLSFLNLGLYFGLTAIILGIGFFKSNAICLIGDCYPNDPVGRGSAFTWYYVSGNLGAVISPVICPYLAQEYGWDFGFIAAAIGMLFGLLMLLMSKKYFKWNESAIPDTKWRSLNSISQFAISLVLLCGSFIFIYFVLKHLMVGKLLISVTVISLIMSASIYKQATAEKRRTLLAILILTIFATGFWIFDQQGASSFSLFIAKFVNRTIDGFTIPTGSFQSINPGIILVFGVIMAWIWKWLGKQNIKPSAISKLSIAMVFLAIGFFLISWGATKVAGSDGNISLSYPVLSLIIIGAAEMFVDPIILTVITNAAPPQSEGRLVALYYLWVGAIANFLAAKVAGFTIDPTQGTGTASMYHQAYSQIVYIACMMFVLLFAWALIYKIRRSAGKALI
jgi:POT family proton-dependent oligopeptide transporter